MSVIATRTFRALACLLSGLLLHSPLLAQEVATSTPVRISVPTAAPVLLVLATPTVTRTPSPAVVVLEAKAEAGPVNVRAEANIESDRLGTIQAGEFYPVLGRQFRWLQIQFVTAPNGRAWVFEELVTLSGDESAIPDLLVATPVVLDQVLAGATQTQDAFLRTPGVLLTMTARSRILPVPGQEGADPGSDSFAGQTGNLLPTYTYPPELVAPASDGDETTMTAMPDEPVVPLSGNNQIPPAVPIALLAAGGLLGLMLNSLRRR